MRKKQDLISASGIQKENSGKDGVTMHFSEKNKLKFRKICRTLLCILTLFRNVLA